MSVQSTLIIDFTSDLSEGDIEDILSENSLCGTKVSLLRNKYAVEVPAGKEQHFATILESIYGIKMVHLPKENKR